MRRVLCLSAQNWQRAFARCLFNKTSRFIEKQYEDKNLSETEEKR